MPRMKIEKQDLLLYDKGVEVRLSRDYSELQRQAISRLETLLAPFPRATEMVARLVSDPETGSNWDMADYLTVSKLGYNDHGEVHHKVVAASAASLLQLLHEGGVTPDVVKAGGGELDDAFLVVTAASLLHDIGNQVHRDGHPEMSVVLSIPVLDRLLSPVYPDPEQRYEMRGFILHAIRTHDIDIRPLTLEAAVVAVADACDMTKARARYVFDVGSISIHTVGALSIERVQIERGQQKPVRVRVELSNSAGIFPVEEYLLPKVNAGDLAQQTEVIITTETGEREEDRRILYTVEMQGKRFVAVGHDQPAKDGQVRIQS